MNHPTSHHSQNRGVSFPPLLFSFPPALPSYLMPILLLIKPAFPRSWFNSLTWQETNAAIKRLSRFPLVFGAPNGREEGLRSISVVPTQGSGATCPHCGQQGTIRLDFAHETTDWMQKHIPRKRYCWFQKMCWLCKCIFLLVHDQRNGDTNYHFQKPLVHFHFD